ncbi:ty3-gypsy retrotransposon protein [Tanacetum coccineum]
MDADEIRLLLKDQALAQQQQAKTFQAQIVALHIELQTTRGLIQTRQGGGGGDLGSPIPRSMRLDVPKFSGSDSESDAFSLARVTKARLEDQGSTATTTKATTSQKMQNTRFVASRLENPKATLLPMPPKEWINDDGAPFAIKWISPAERQERLSKGLCFNCDHKWVRGHRCLGKFLLLMADDKDDKEPITETTQGDVMERGDISILNSLVGHGSPRSLQLWGSLGSGKKLGKVTHDYSQKTMEFMLAGRGYTLRGDEALRMKLISLHHMRALLETDDIYGVYELYNMAHHDEDRDDKTEATPSVHPDIAQLLAQFESLFQVPTTLPPHRSIDHHIHLYPNTKPVNVRPYRYPHYQKGEIEKLVNEMLGQGIIRVSQSPFSSPVLLVKKKDGSYRFYVDYRALNEVTIKDKFPIPTTDDMFELGGAVIFTKLNLRAGYHQIREHERDAYKTAFRTHDGHYEFLVMPFGLTNAPYTFQATMNRLFSPYLCKFVIVFFDDILIYSANLAAHLEHLHCVFQCLQDNHFYVKESKCVFGATTLEYLGHIISGHDVEMDPKKISAVVDWPIPTNQRQVRGFLGLAGYYRRFIKDYATIAAPLSSLLQKKGFKWGELEKQAFDDLKTRLSDAPVLGLPNFEEMFVVEADASAVGIGVVLMQKGHPLCYFSRKLGPRMRVAATYQKELFAIVEAVYKWRHYLLGRHFTIRTDHRSLKELLHQVIQMPLQQKYVRKLMGFDFAIEYKPGVSNQVADALSRVFEEEGEVTAAFMTLSQPLVGLLDKLRQENESLEELQVLHRRIDSNEVMEGFRREQGLLLFRDRYYVGAESKLKELLLSEFQDTPMAGHSGVKKMLVGLSALFYRKRMQQSVEVFISKCLVCQQTKYSTQAPGGLLQPLPTPNRVWEDVSIDFITGLPNYNGLTVMLVVVDRFTKYAHFGALPTSFTTSKVVEKQLFEVSGTKLNHSTKYHPQTDGQTEVVNRGLEQYLQAMVLDRPQHWVRFLAWAEYSYNTTFHSSVKMMSFQAVYGRVPPSIVPYPPGSLKVAAIEELLVDRDALLRQLKQNLLVAKQRMETQANRTRHDVEFNVGNKVLVKQQPYRQVTLAKRHSNKLAKRYYRPFEILERVGKVAYRLALSDSSKIHPVFHVSLLMPFLGSDQEGVTNLPEEEHEGHPVEQPLAICATHVVLQNDIPARQVLVQWNGS